MKRCVPQGVGWSRLRQDCPASLLPPGVVTGIQQGPWVDSVFLGQGSYPGLGLQPQTQGEQWRRFPRVPLLRDSRGQMHLAPESSYVLLLLWLIVSLLMRCRLAKPMLL